jgi:hypothetical protein
MGVYVEIAVHYVTILVESSGVDKERRYEEYATSSSQIRMASKL